MKTMFTNILKWLGLVGNPPVSPAGHDASDILPRRSYVYEKTKPLPLGEVDFKIVGSDCYYLDKT